MWYFASWLKCHNQQSAVSVLIFANEETEVRASLYTCHPAGGMKYIAAQYSTSFITETHL